VLLLAYPSISSHLVPCRSISSHLVPCRPISSHLVPCRPISSHLVPSRPISSHHVPSRPFSSLLVPSRPISSHLLPSRPITSHLVPSRPISSHRQRSALSPVSSRQLQGKEHRKIKSCYLLFLPRHNHVITTLPVTITPFLLFFSSSFFSLILLTRFYILRLVI